MKMDIVFVDTNVILDVLLKNEGLWQDSLQIFRLAEKGIIQAFVSASSMTDIFYIVRKRYGIPSAREALYRILAIFSVVNVDGDDLREALGLPISDVEDALQAWCALKINASALVTRDTDDFSGIVLPVLSPTEIIDRFE
jgi:predicted nucleic acid-binding protein